MHILYSLCDIQACATFKHVRAQQQHNYTMLFSFILLLGATVEAELDQDHSVIGGGRVVYTTTTTNNNHKHKHM